MPMFHLFSYDQLLSDTAVSQIGFGVAGLMMLEGARATLTSARPGPTIGEHSRRIFQDIRDFMVPNNYDVCLLDAQKPEARQRAVASVRGFA